MDYKTNISKVTENDVIIRGEKLSYLIKNWNFTDVIFLEISGRKPRKEESIIFEKLLVSIIDHGMGTASSQTARFVASSGNSLNVAVGGGVLSLGDYHGGATGKAMEQFYAWQQKNPKEIAKIIEELLLQKATIYGFGHKVTKDEDPRVTFIIEEMEKCSFKSSFLHLKEIVEKKFKEMKGKILPLNIDGLMAMILCDFGFPPHLGKGVFIIGRVPSLVAQALEELTSEKPVRRVDENEIQYLPDVKK